MAAELLEHISSYGRGGYSFNHPGADLGRIPIRAQASLRESPVPLDLNTGNPQWGGGDLKIACTLSSQDPMLTQFILKSIHVFRPSSPTTRSSFPDFYN